MTTIDVLKLGVIDVKDFMILALINDGYSFSEIGRKLNISPSAITQRTYRYMEIWQGWHIKLTRIENTYDYKLSRKAVEVCAAARKIISILETI